MTASTSSWERSGGFILVLVSKEATASSVRVKWCGVASQVTAMRRCLAGADGLHAELGGDVGDVDPLAR